MTAEYEFAYDRADEYEKGTQLELTWHYDNALPHQTNPRTRNVTVQKEFRGILFLWGEFQHYQIRKNGRVWAATNENGRHYNLGHVVSLTE